MMAIVCGCTAAIMVAHWALKLKRRSQASSTTRWPTGKDKAVQTDHLQPTDHYTSPSVVDSNQPALPWSNSYFMLSITQWGSCFLQLYTLLYLPSQRIFYPLPHTEAAYGHVPTPELRSRKCQRPVNFKLAWKLQAFFYQSAALANVIKNVWYLQRSTYPEPCQAIQRNHCGLSLEINAVFLHFPRVS